MEGGIYAYERFLWLGDVDRLTDEGFKFASLAGVDCALPGIVISVLGGIGNSV
jgi:hypothetical protein